MSQQETLLFINKEDVFKLGDLKRTMAKVKEAMLVLESGEYLMPERLSATYKERTVLSMPALTNTASGTKLLTVTPSNIKLGLPSIFGLMTVNDFTTGKPLAIIDGSALTSLRTGAVGGLAVDYLAPKNAKSVGIAGCGAQGFYQLIYTCCVRPIERVYLYDAYAKDLTNFIERVKKALCEYKIEEKITFVVCKDTKELISQSEIVITATTSNTPIFDNDKTLFHGKTIIGVGSYQPTCREFPDAIFGEDTAVFIELPFAKEETGDLAIPIENGLIKTEDIHLLVELDKKPELMKKTNFFKTVGMALYDIVVANDLYIVAKEKNAGQVVKL
ncbi:ornithine cyclodeaminase, putative [Entamoeba invadens IP1]|uniref:Ornithine cyclodeaminase, putative n=1 Tax=Entamoeba invadens IP1 TaxID=370355 RepID=A0A0A1U6X7_ENTIV|nr:ornithine cyclodeaminase, putative [Entamoeba invadens IP1]ELP90147.1 ornithine cyclodeaminase, putative [Entamoeba invadens IP1]|eukprot:XP_004256918.1 ornithine cyclodeaminase, putative [Entamoeba invadens IP1]